MSNGRVAADGKHFIGQALWTGSALEAPELPISELFYWTRLIHSSYNLLSWSRDSPDSLWRF